MTATSFHMLVVLRGILGTEVIDGQPCSNWFVLWPCACGGFDHLPNKTQVASLRKSLSDPCIYALPISTCIQKGIKEGGRYFIPHVGGTKGNFGDPHAPILGVGCHINKRENREKGDNQIHVRTRSFSRGACTVKRKGYTTTYKGQQPACYHRNLYTLNTWLSSIH